ncbi:MAG: hypothetical protein KDD37_11070, partial [Bdellovibrionales bacterium]|nr:hypothetical protein [Bdellovibrionales bacterium]
MKISESRLSGLYFFFAFLALVFGFSIYKSFYAVVSPKYLQEVLRNRLEREVELYELKVDVVDFNFFHGIFFQPGLAWKGFHISYSKNCNYVEASSPDIYFAVDLTGLFRRKLELKEVITSQLDLKIIKDYACADDEQITQIDESALKPIAPIIGAKQKVRVEDLAFVKNLPEFRVGKLKLFTERNASRYMDFTNLNIRRAQAGYSFQSDLTFSESFNVGSIPQLKINGNFDENQNIRINSRLREAKLDLEIEPLGDKNFKTTFTVSDFPLQYVLNMLGARYPEVTKLKPLVGEWIHIKTHTVSRWDDFFDKNIIMYFEELRLTGDTAKLISEPFQLKLRDRSLASTSKVKLEMLAMDEIFSYVFTPDLRQHVMNPGIVSGDLSIQTDGKILFDGMWKNMSLFIEPYGLKKNIEILPTKVSYEYDGKEGLFNTKDLALNGAAGDMSISSLTKDGKLTAKFSATNLIANEIWQKLFSASVDFADIDVDLVQDDMLRWKGEAKYRGVRAKEFNVTKGKLKFERNSISDKINWYNEGVSLIGNSNLQTWIADAFDQKLVPEIVRLWKTSYSRDLNKALGVSRLEFFGAKPKFSLILEQ